MWPHPRSKKRYRRDRLKYERRQQAIRWLAEAICGLFPGTSWKDDIPLFEGANTNKGIIWSFFDNDTLRAEMSFTVALPPLPDPGWSERPIYKYEP